METPTDMPTLQEIKASARSGSSTPEETLAALDAYIGAHPGDDDALTERGLLYWSLEKRAAAINDYLAAIKINPESRARQAIKSAYDILNFFNKDLYNP